MNFAKFYDNLYRNVCCAFYSEKIRIRFHIRLAAADLKYVLADAIIISCFKRVFSSVLENYILDQLAADDDVGEVTAAAALRCVVENIWRCFNTFELWTFKLKIQGLKVYLTESFALQASEIRWEIFIFAGLCLYIAFCTFMYIYIYILEPTFIFSLFIHNFYMCFWCCIYQSKLNFKQRLVAVLSDNDNSPSWSLLMVLRKWKQIIS